MMMIRDDSQFTKFTSVIREDYRNRQVNRDKQWPPCFADNLVKLALRQEVYNVYYNKLQRGQHDSSSNQEKLDYDSIFNVKEGRTKVKRILVEGDAGIGKTTLCTSISVDWAEHKKLKQFKLLLLLPLRHREVTSVHSVTQLLQLYHPNKEVCESVANGFLKGELGKQVLIIADGWDELEESQRKKGSFIHKLLFENAIHSATVMITSRPTASVALHKYPFNNYIDRFIEVDGFDELGIEEYIKSEFSGAHDKESQEGLLKYVKSNPLIRSVCHVPINCAIICHMWRSDEKLPSTMTMTHLYTKIILHFILRALQKTFPEFDLESLNSFDAIPEKLQEHLWLLCEFACLALVQSKFVFSYEELAKVFPKAASQNQFFSFGLMQSAQAFLGVGRGASFHFLHRTFQEYLSALHCLKRPPLEQIKLMKPYAYLSQMAIVMRFAIGLGSSGDKVSSKIVPIERDVVCKTFEISNRLRVSCFGFTNDLVTHGIHEAQGGYVKDYLMQLVYGDHFTFAFPRNVHDCAAVVNAIGEFNEAINDPTTVSFKFDNCHLGEDLLKSLAIALHKKKGKLQVVTLLIRGNNLSDRAISILMKMASVAFKSLKQLSLAANSLGDKAVRAISENLVKSNLKHLTLSYNPLGASGIAALQNVIEADTLANLTTLQLKCCSLHDSEACASLFKALPGHCICLKQLDVSENHLEKPALIGESMGKLLQEHKTLSEIHANEICLSDEGIKALTNVLSTGDRVALNILSIKKNGIQSVGASLLAECVRSMHISVSDSFCLDSNPIEAKGVIALGAVLNTKSVSMSDCQLTVITEDIRKCFKEMLSQLPQSESCHELILDNNCFTEEHIIFLVELIRICPELRYLSCARCEIDSGDLETIIKNTNCSLANLVTWLLYNNRLDDEGCSQLVTAVYPDRKLPNVTGIFLHGNPEISIEMLQYLEDIIAKHRVSYY